MFSVLIQSPQVKRLDFIFSYTASLSVPFLSYAFICICNFSSFLSSLQINVYEIICDDEDSIEVPPVLGSCENASQLQDSTSGDG
jgi:hypothetical protein